MEACVLLSPARVLCVQMDIRTTRSTTFHCSCDCNLNRFVTEMFVSLSDKDYDNAIKYYSEALELNPGNAVYFSNRSLAYLRTECYGYALADATRALEIDKNYIKGYYRRATSNMALGKFKAALKDYETVSNYLKASAGTGLLNRRSFQTDLCLSCLK